MMHDGSIHATHGRDLRLSGAIALLLHAALLLLIGLAVTPSRARFTAPTVQTILLEVELPVTTPPANILVTPAAAPVDTPVPQAIAAPPVDAPVPQAIAAPPVDAPVLQAVAAPRPAMPATTEERLPCANAPPEIAPASLAPALADGVTTLVATEALAKNLSGHDTAAPTVPTAAPTVPTATAPPTAAPTAAAPATGAPSAITLRRALQPPYPLGARQRGEEGSVVLDTTVTPDGTATQVSIVSSSGFADLDRAAVKALRRAGFHPATEKGRPVEARARLTITFRLTNP